MTQPPLSDKYECAICGGRVRLADAGIGRNKLTGKVTSESEVFECVKEQCGNRGHVDRPTSRVKRMVSGETLVGLKRR